MISSFSRDFLLAFSLSVHLRASPKAPKTTAHLWAGGGRRRSAAVILRRKVRALVLHVKSVAYEGCGALEIVRDRSCSAERGAKSGNHNMATRCGN